jgi:hypothetical protein
MPVDVWTRVGVTGLGEISIHKEEMSKGTLERTSNEPSMLQKDVSAISFKSHHLRLERNNP